MEKDNENKNLLRNDHYRNYLIDRGGNPMEMKYLVIFLIGSLIFLSSFLLFREFTGLHKKIDDLGKRISILEKSKNKRMPYEAFENILDACAALNKEKEEFQFFISLIENAEAHLEKAVTIGTKREDK